MRTLNECYVRLLVDNHITEHHPSLMRRFDPEVYVQTVKDAGFESAMVYASCHNGNCYYPTRVGHMHKNLDGRDIFGQTVSLLKDNGIVPCAYHTVIYQRDVAIANPRWRMVFADGSQSFQRAWFNCPNNPSYREFALQQVSEIAAYDVASLFIDMTFWPGVCVCRVCREKYRTESDAEIPEVVDWNHPGWVGFQRTRERWLGDFARMLTAQAKQVRPELLVTHQCAPILLGWFYAQRNVPEFCDYTSGDFYGGLSQQRLGTKVMSLFCRRPPYEFMTTKCVSLADHTSKRSELEMLSHAAGTLANGGAYLFIDAINPDGTLDMSGYRRFGSINKKLKPFADNVRNHAPVLVADTALYFSMASHFNSAHNGLTLQEVQNPPDNMDPSNDLPALKELTGTAALLNRANMPYKVVGPDFADREMDGVKTLVLNNVTQMSDGEIQRIRRFTADGGALIVTGLTSLYDTEGRKRNDFGLADVLGIGYSGTLSDRVSYLYGGGDEFVFCNAPAPYVTAVSADVLARVATPYFSPEDYDHFASYHSNPPGPVTGFAALTQHSFGKGRAVYLYSSILSLQQDSQQRFVQDLFRRVAPSSFIVDSNAPACVEVTILKSTRKDAYLICFVNFQKEEPAVPVCDIRATFLLARVNEQSLFRRVSNSSVPVDVIFASDTFTIHLDRVETIEIVEVQY